MNRRRFIQMMAAAPVAIVVGIKLVEYEPLDQTTVYKNWHGYPAGTILHFPEPRVPHGWKRLGLIDADGVARMIIKV